MIDQEVMITIFGFIGFNPFTKLFSALISFSLLSLFHFHSKILVFFPFHDDDKLHHSSISQPEFLPRVINELMIILKNEWLKWKRLVAKTRWKMFSRHKDCGIAKNWSSLREWEQREREKKNEWEKRRKNVRNKSHSLGNNVKRREIHYQGKVNSFLFEISSNFSPSIFSSFNLTIASLFSYHLSFNE